ncbi:S-adenosyl-L-methionine-dependent methyltransferase [Tribonema minus]|uniref:S-adenosyl-L-methionine-dependent methyltransferase n=1 Tax=Tribonema minus TaxID=303371 RepID=A0A835Z088_9STRA|nr:S-adenosyl-L-methionine-dependent methyltransferase [Tribonema minus]
MVFGGRLASHPVVDEYPSDADTSDQILVKEVQLSQGTLFVGMSATSCVEIPGNGGLRIGTYASPAHARDETIKLTEAMYLKHRMYNTGFTGAKLVFAAHAPPPLSPPRALCKRALMDEVAAVLNSMRGAVYTGCDMGTTHADMERLSAASPYVLAGIGSDIDPNAATAAGAFAAVARAAERLGLGRGFSVLVQGAGNVGTDLARRLVQHGATVYATDIDVRRADIRGVTNVSHVRDLSTIDVDVFSPNAAAGVITEDLARRLRCRAIVGAANIPFASEAARSIAIRRGIVAVPDHIVSAGAIIVDSLEWKHEGYAALRPSLAYAFIMDQVRGALHTSAAASSSSSAQRHAALSSAVAADPASAPVGARLVPWLAGAAEERDVLVVGAGMAGTAAAYQLAARAPRLRGVVLEAGEGVAPPRGSSHGDSRMFRRMYSDPYFSDLQDRALDMWRALEAEARTPLLAPHGLLFYGDADTGETVEGSIPGCADVMRRRGVPHEYFASGAALAARFGCAPRPPAGGAAHVGLFEPAAGSVDAGAACRAMMARAADGGRWELRTHAAVADIWREDGGDKYNVVTSDGQVFVVDSIVIAAGAWTNELLKHFGIELDLEIWGVHWGHYKLAEGAQSPQWFHFGKDDELVYGFPGRDGVGKVGADFSPQRHRYKSMDDFEYAPDAEVSSQITEFVQGQWGALYKEPVNMVTSPYTMTKDSMFILDTLPGHPKVSLFSGGNGRAFKFAPILGRALADLVLGDEPVFDIERMRMTRPGLLAKSGAPAASSAAASSSSSTASTAGSGSITGTSGAGSSGGAASGGASDDSDHVSNGNGSSSGSTSAFGRAHVPYGSEGAATYSNLTLGCFDVVMNARDLAEDCVAALRLGEGNGGARRVRIADYGSADGGPLMPLIAHLRSAIPESCEMEVCFEDQPNNDFKSLFYLANGIAPLPVAAPALRDVPGVFWSATGRSFFEQCFPAASVDMGTSFTALHWLSAMPCGIPDAAHHTQSGDADAGARFEAQAAADWHTILTHRARELRPGGQMVVATLARSPEGRYLGHSGAAGEANMYAVLDACWARMRDEGAITAAECAAASFCNYYRGERELRAPFEDSDGGAALGLALRRLEWREIACPFGRGAGTPEQLVGTVRTWSNSTFLSALDEGRGREARAALVDELFARYRDAIAADPSAHHMDYTHAYLHFERV